MPSFTYRARWFIVLIQRKKLNSHICVISNDKHWVLSLKKRTFALRAKAGCTRCKMLKQVWHLTRLHCLCIRSHLERKCGKRLNTNHFNLVSTETWKWAWKARYNTYIEIVDFQHDEFVSISRVIAKMRVVPIKRLKRFQSIV